MTVLWLTAKAWSLGLWNFAKTPLGRGLLLVLAIVGALWTAEQHGYSRGVATEKAAEATRQAAAEKTVRKLAADGAAITAKVASDLKAANARNAELTHQLQQKVSTYVTPQADRRCVIPDGYVRLRDAAGAGVAPVPPAAGGSVDADSGLALSDLSQNDLLIAAAFHALFEEVKAWRRWYAAQAELWKSNTMAPDPAP